ncbi:hypothetical protein MOQ_007620 [Trypanosoma cruzi marinkellei]|uniref:AB hydrolase-1 domain-containing protein n=1 Tax=Trypanosoma cruzi marinkellei TaxID=85056 RepID=K2MNE7_TRYCR|nr:hypothetical protein MOQ_007620 [Trypanosoma cruzi marinkellei]
MTNNTIPALSCDRYSRFGEKCVEVGVCKSTGVRIRLCYQTFGKRDAAGGVVLLIMGLASPSLLWDMKFCECLASRGYYVIRFDNRDMGRSTFLTDRRVIPATATNNSTRDEMDVWNTNIFSSSSSSSSASASASSSTSDSWFGAFGDSKLHLMRLAYASVVSGGHQLFREVYTLEDMARDSVGLLDALNVYKAHIVGMCMGGMIAQLVAIYHPTRVESLSLLSTYSGTLQAGRPSLREAFALAQVATYIARKGFAVSASLRGKNGKNSSPSPKDEKALAHTLVNLIARFAPEAKPSFSIDREACFKQVQRILRRSSDFSGVLRQYVALLNAEDRTAGLKRIHVPTVILHGTKDPIVPYVNGKQLAGMIPHAKLVTLEGVGHVLHPALREKIIDTLAANMQQSRRGKQDLPTTSRL